MKKIIFTLITLIILSGCTPRGFTDLFRRPELRGLSHPERLFKRALMLKPDLVDTMANDTAATSQLKPDTNYVNNLIDLAVDESDSIWTAKLDSLKKLGVDSGCINEILLLRTQIKQLTKVKTKSKSISLPVPKVLQDTMRVPFKNGMVKIWQDGDKIKADVHSNTVKFNNPCPDPPRFRWWELILFGIFIGVFLTLMCFILVKALK